MKSLMFKAEGEKLEGKAQSSKLVKSVNSTERGETGKKFKV